VRVSGEGSSEVEVRRLVSAKDQLIFVFNHAEKPAQASISISVPWAVREARDIVADRPVKFNSREGSVVFDKDLNSGAIWVLKLTAAD
jgi:hypothetical protein